MKKYYLLPIFLLVSILLVAALGGYLKYSLFARLKLDTEENIISLPFVLLTDEQLYYRFDTSLAQYRNPPALSETVSDTKPTQSLETEPSVAATTSMERIPTETRPAVTVPTQPAYIELDDSWFDDVLFIGESRIDGMKLAARLGNAEYFSDSGVTVFNVMDIAASDQKFYKTKLDEILTWQKYGKIIIHLGINECSKYPENFAAQYQSVIDFIRRKQPDAYIILHSILPVTRDYAAYLRIHPDDIAIYNQQIQSLVTDERMRYIDIGKWCTDKEGYLLEELTNDGCHPHGHGNLQWTQWLKEECGWLGIP